MATVKIPLDVTQAVPASTNGPQFAVAANGTRYLAFDAATEETCIFPYIIAQSYGSGNLTLNIDWTAASATSGDVIWGAAIAAQTQNTDSEAADSYTLATAQTVTDTHLGTTATRVHRTTLTISNLDSLAADDRLVLSFYRDADAGGDTMTGDAWLLALELTYSDT